MIGRREDGDNPGEEALTDSNSDDSKHRRAAERIRLTAATHCNYNVPTMATKTRIIRIGNSRGIRIPRALLEQAELPEEIEIQAEPGRLIVTGAPQPRAGWAEAAKEMRTKGDDRLIDEPLPTEFDREEWQW